MMLRSEEKRRDAARVSELGFQSDPVRNPRFSKFSRVSKFYAVKNGRANGIYRSWSDCDEQVWGFSGAQFKSFKTFEEAIEYLEG